MKHFVLTQKHLQKTFYHSPNFTLPSKNVIKIKDPSHHAKITQKKKSLKIEKDYQKTIFFLNLGLQRRKEELEKIETLSVNIENELQKLTERQIDMQQEMANFKSQYELVQEHNELKGVLTYFKKNNFFVYF